MRLTIIDYWPLPTTALHAKLCPAKIASSNVGFGPPWFLEPTWVHSQTASGSVQQFQLGSQLCPADTHTHRQTDWPTDHATTVTIGHIYALSTCNVCNVAPTNVMQAYNNCGLISSLMNYLNILVKTMLFYPEQLHQHTALKCAVRPPCILQQIVLRTAVLQCPQQLQVVQYAGT